MAKTSTLSLSVGVSGDGLAQSTYTPPQSPVVNTNAPEGVPIVVTLASGANSIAIPAGAQYAVLSPLTTSLLTKNAKTTSGDVGIAFVTQVVVLPVAGLSTLFVTNGGATPEPLSIAWV